ncbi:MAG: chorion class high-cysteine HCB protein 13 [Eubacteriales bacterium]|nr:chorion class high-cysteine HCB protein 13 [Eubacteriales bacterium]
MSDLSNCGCGCESNMNDCGRCGRSGDCGCGFGNNSCLWIILLLIFCGGCGNGFGRGGDCGCGCGNDSCLWIILLLIFCGGCGNGFGCC